MPHDKEYLILNFIRVFLTKRNIFIVKFDIKAPV